MSEVRAIHVSNAAFAHTYHACCCTTVHSSVHATMPPIAPAPTRRSPSVWTRSISTRMSTGCTQRSAVMNAAPEALGAPSRRRNRWRAAARLLGRTAAPCRPARGEPPPPRATTTPAAPAGRRRELIPGLPASRRIASPRGRRGGRWGRRRIWARPPARLTESGVFLPRVRAAVKARAERFRRVPCASRTPQNHARNVRPLLLPGGTRAACGSQGQARAVRPARDAGAGPVRGDVREVQGAVGGRVRVVRGARGGEEGVVEEGGGRRRRRAFNQKTEEGEAAAGAEPQPRAVAAR